MGGGHPEPLRSSGTWSRCVGLLAWCLPFGAFWRRLLVTVLLKLLFQKKHGGGWVCDNGLLPCHQNSIRALATIGGNCHKPGIFLRKPGKRCGESRPIMICLESCYGVFDMRKGGIGDHIILFRFSFQLKLIRVILKCGHCYSSIMVFLKKEKMESQCLAQCALLNYWFSHLLNAGITG